MTDTDDSSFTRPQVFYWLASGLLMVIGVLAVILADSMPFPWLHTIFKELGPATFTAGILAALVEPFFRKEFARDAFQAAFRYVLPPELKNEVARILKYDFICHKHLWTVKVDKVDEEMVRITTTFERDLKNVTSETKLRHGFYQVYEWDFKIGRSEILECTIQGEEGEVVSFEKIDDKVHSIEAKTQELVVKPQRSVKVCGKAVQYKRINDSIYETFLTPAVNPEIEVFISDDFEHSIEFGSEGRIDKLQYQNRYVLSGVYFPQHFMIVRWWPKRKSLVS